MSRKKSALVWSQILRLFVNSLTTGDKYSRRNMRNFPQQVEAPLTQKEKGFFGFFMAFPKCAWNLESFEKNNEYPSLVISKIIDPERGGYLNV